MDNDLSQDMFELFLERLDPHKEFFTQKDVDNLSRYKLTLDEALQQNDFGFFNTAISLLEYKRAKVESHSLQVLSEGQDFAKKERLEMNTTQLPYAANDKALQDRWRKKVKKYLLDQLYAEEVNHPSTDEDTRLATAKEKVHKLLSLKFQKLKTTKDAKYVETYVNSFLKVHDFQSEYLSPKEKTEWDQKFTRSFVGVGVRLEIENVYPKVTEIVIGGPAWKTGLLKANDEILSINEQGAEPVDLMGKPMEEVISLLKGEKGTIVYLTIKDKDARVKTIEIKRDKIEFDLAMSFLLNTNQAQQKIGYIRLPRFYGGNPGSAAHVRKEVEGLKANGVEGIIVDVRNNQGGSARGCRQIIDLFLADGIYMQTKRSSGEINQLYGDDSSVQYDGKLLVLTNSKSGSASELFSGTLQDYKRALIVGSESTYGKGSVQNFIDLNEPGDSISKFGQMKLSVALFYTASGRSPQSTGIIPDVTLTDDGKYSRTGERTQAFSMPSDALPPTDVRQDIYVVKNIDQLWSKSQARTKDSKAFQLAEEKAKRMAEQQKSHLVELDKVSYQKQMASKLASEKKWSEIFSTTKGFTVTFDRTPFQQDAISISKREKWVDRIQSDPYIYECFQIINDMAG